MNRFRSHLVPFVFVVLGLALAHLDVVKQAHADSPWQGAKLLNTAGVLSSNGSARVALFSVANTGGTAIYLGGVSINNTDSSSHVVSLVSHTSGRVMWQNTLPATSGVLLDSVQLLESDAGAAEGVDLTLESGGGTKVAISATAYAK